jgi:predicted TPR repeat methyltransferase
MDPQPPSQVDIYDEEAEATGWLGPQVVFGMAFEFIERGESLLDIGIGTGLGAAPFARAGLAIHGMDRSQQMLTACHAKGFATDLRRHDLTVFPYPYDSDSIDHVICMGVFNFFDDLSPIFAEIARIQRAGGVFGFVVGSRAAGEESTVVVDAEQSMVGVPVTMYRHDQEQIEAWLSDNRYVSLRRLEFNAYMDRANTQPLPMRAYLARK